MEPVEQSGKLTEKDRRAQRAWTVAPWVALVLITVFPPAVLAILALILGGAPLWLLAVAPIPACLIVHPHYDCFVDSPKKLGEARARAFSVRWHHGRRS